MSGAIQATCPGEFNFDGMVQRNCLPARIRLRLRQANVSSGAAAAMSYDVIVVGSGATGSWAAKQLTEGGRTVLVLEAGPHAGAARPVGHRQDVQSRCYAYNEDTRHLFVDDVDNPYETPSGTPFAWIRMRLVGGRTVLWHRVALRMSDRQFKAASFDGFGSDWPISYADLQPYYDEAERFLGVAGTAARHEEIPDGVFLSAQLSPAALRFQESLQREWPDRQLTVLRRARCESPIQQHRGPYRSDADVDICFPTCSAGVALAAAESTSRLVLRTNSAVSRVICDESGRRVLGVEYVDCRTGATRVELSKVTVLCASTIETTRIMLNSRSTAHPNGIGNGNGLLGRQLTEHVSGAGAMGLRDGECHGESEFYIPNFRNRNGRAEKFLRGYGIQGYIKPGPGKTTQCTLVSFGEMLPRMENQVTLGNTQDRWGIPVARVACRYSDNELEMARDQATQATQMLRQAGFDVTSVNGLNPVGCSIHEAGTAPMGRDPNTSSLNPYNRCWQVPNLLVTDGTAFPSVGFQNPTLTLMALTGRACRHILEEFHDNRW
jgi:choline dehydrogenase-like flavoprotein